VVASIVCLGCANGGGDDSEAPRRTSDAATDSASAGGDASIFAVEDTTAPAEDTEPAPAEDTEPVDTGELDTAPPTTTLTVDTIECRTITCPSTHPYVIGCSITMSGASSIGCAVHITGGTTLSFKEGQSCGDTTVRGTVMCSSVPGTGLNAANCFMNKGTKLYVSTISSCPT
jgi:hypothetical protein